MDYDDNEYEQIEELLSGLNVEQLKGVCRVKGLRVSESERRGCTAVCRSPASFLRRLRHIRVGRVRPQSRDSHRTINRPTTLITVNNITPCARSKQHKPTPMRKTRNDDDGRTTALPPHHLEHRTAVCTFQTRHKKRQRNNPETTTTTAQKKKKNRWAEPEPPSSPASSSSTPPSSERKEGRRRHQEGRSRACRTRAPTRPR